MNDAPVASDVTLASLEDQAVTINLVAADADNTLATLQFVIQTQPTHGSLEHNADGSYRYTPVANYFGADSFTYTVTDGDLVSNVATVRLTVSAVNDAPVLPSRSISVNEDASIVIDPLTGAVDIDGDTLAAQVVAGPQHGSLTVNADGSFSYTAEANYFGTDSFTYRVSDGQLDSEVATVSFSIAAVNDAPVASDVTLASLEDQAVTINLVAADADSTLATLQFVIQTQPIHGSLEHNPDGSYKYTPVANYFGSDSFTYTVTDGDLVSNMATVRINVSEVNDAPVAKDLAATLAEDGFIVLDIAAQASDLDGDLLTLSADGATYGSVTRLLAHLPRMRGAQHDDGFN